MLLQQYIDSTHVNRIAYTLCAGLFVVFLAIPVRGQETLIVVNRSDALETSELLYSETDSLQIIDARRRKVGMVQPGQLVVIWDYGRDRNRTHEFPTVALPDGGALGMVTRGELDRFRENRRRERFVACNRTELPVRVSSYDMKRSRPLGQTLAAVSAGLQAINAYVNERPISGQFWSESAARAASTHELKHMITLALDDEIPPIIALEITIEGYDVFDDFVHLTTTRMPMNFGSVEFELTEPDIPVQIHRAVAFVSALRYLDGRTERLSSCE